MSRQNSANPLRTSLLTARRRRRLILESLENRLLLAGQIPLAVELPEPSAGSQAANAIQFAGGTLPSDSPEPNAPGLGTTIAGITFDEDSAQTGFLQIPPDPIGAAGPNHVVSVVNSTIEWHTKAGVQQFSDQLGQNGSGVDGFFAPVNPVNLTFDPKVIYDQHAGRFVVVALEKTDDNDGSTTGDADDTSRILIAVSDDSDPNGTWRFMAINSKTNIGGVDRWADYPGFAVDEDAIYVTNNLFGFNTSGTFGGVRLWIIPKGIGTGGIYDASGGSFTIHDPYAGGGIATTTQPAHIYGTAPGTTGTFLVSYSGLSGGGIEAVQVVRVDDPLGTPSFSQQFVSVGDIEDTAAAFNDAPQSGTANLVETNDRRALNAVWRNDSLWLTATIVGSGVDAGQTTSYWWELNTTNLASITVAQQGGVGAEDIAAGAYTFMSSIAVDANENMAIGFAVSAPTIFPSAGYTGRKAGAAAGTTEAAAVMAPGVASYFRTFGGTRNRWGDYSGTSLDPADERTFWVFNQYAMTQGTPDGLGHVGRWATQWGSFQFNTPPTITITSFNAAENQTAAGIVTASDIDNDTLTFSESGGADASLLSITTGGVLTFDAAPDFENATDANTDGIYEIEVTVSDGHGGTDVETILVTVTDVVENGPPVFDAGTDAFSVAEGQTAVGTVSATDPELDTLTYTLGGGVDDGFFSVDSGTGALTFIAAPNFEDAVDDGGNDVYDVIVSVSDGVNPAVNQNVVVTVTNLNDAPVLDTEVPVVLDPVAEDTASPAGTLVAGLLSAVIDEDAGALAGVAVSGVSNANGLWQYTLDGTTWLNFGSPTRAAARLLAADATSRVRFRPNANFDGGSVLFLFAWDQTAGAAGGTADLLTAGTTGGTTAFSTGAVQGTIDVTPVNDAPVLSTGTPVTLDAVTEDTTSPAGTLVSALVGGVSDADAGANKGLAVSGVSNANGLWQYTLNGTTWLNFGGPTRSAVRLLAADATTRIRFKPNANFNGTSTLFVFAWDQTSGANGGTVDLSIGGTTGGTTAFSSAVVQGSVSVTPVNDAPVLNTGVAANLDPIDEDTAAPAGTLVSSLVGGISDVDAVAVKGIAVSSVNGFTGLWQYTLNGVDWVNFGSVSKGAVRLLAADATTRVRMIPNGNFNGTTSMWFFAWDQTQGTAGDTANLTAVGSTGGTTAFSNAAKQSFLTVTPVDDKPVLGGISGSIGYTLGNPAVVVAPSATVSDVDSANFDTGELLVHITAGASAANQLELAGFTIGAGNAVMQGATQIGTRTSDGLNGNDLRITLNANATVAVVQQLVRGVTFRATSTTGSRTVVYSVSDGDGETSMDVSKTVVVS